MKGSKKSSKKTERTQFIISKTLLAKSRAKKSRAKKSTRRDSSRNLFAPALPPPGVVPAGVPTMAMDNRLTTTAGWAGDPSQWAWSEGLEFLGYPYLSELSQRPEYRRLVELIATEMTSKWISVTSNNDEVDNSDKIKVIEDELERMQVQFAFRKIAEQDGFFGRAHLYLDFSGAEDQEELLTPIGDGRDRISKAKVSRNSFKAVRPVEAVWTYPTDYNSNDPLREDWYKPTVWYVMGRQVHASRLLTFIGREVPDLLKPAYSFGGLALTQMVKTYIDNWLQTRDAVNGIVSAFAQFVMKTNMQESVQQDGDQLFERVELFNNLRNNAGTMVIDKESEDFAIVSVPLGGLDLLQAQSQEHICSISGTPIVKYLGIQPAGLNASSDGELTTWYEWVVAYQKSMFGHHLTRVVNFIQLSKFGKVDPDIGYRFNPLQEMTEQEIADLNAKLAETGEKLIGEGVISPEEERRRLANDPQSPYEGLDPDDMPDLEQEEEQGLEPEGGRPNSIEGKGGGEEQPAPKKEEDGGREAA